MFLLRVVKQAWPRPACRLVPSETPGRPQPLLPAGRDLHALGEASAVPWGGVPVRGHTAGSHPLDRRHPGLLAPIKPGPQESNSECFNVCSLSPFSLTPHFCPSTLGAPSPLGFLSRLLCFPAAAAPVSSVSRPSSHDFSFCLSDSFKQKHTSKAPQRGSSLNFSDFWFSCPFFPPPESLLPLSSPVMLVSKSGMAWR